MNPAAILTEAKNVGVEISIQAGKIKLLGEESYIGRLLPLFKTHKAEIISLMSRQEGNYSSPEKPVPETIDALKPCPLCHGRDFIHGYNGGYFCLTCQPDARPGVPVKAGGYRVKNEFNDSKGNITKNVKGVQYEMHSQNT